jgi:phosphoribosyl-ATP pyrophosphohydrolase/phosphoribosyl-AMP cyclohydrolase
VSALIPGIVQDDLTGRVLMLGYLNQESLQLTRQTGLVHFWSRSRQELWQKGATSGNTLQLVSISEDCDRDALLIRVRPAGPVCHTGTASCFSDDPGPILARLWATVLSRRERRPTGSYTARVLDQGVEGAGRKVVEEAVEVLLAAKDHAGGKPEARVTEEAADLVYHLLLLLAERQVDWQAVLAELAARHQSR